MSTCLATHRADHAERWRTLRTLLLACGALFGLAYVVANDLVAATIYDGYSRIDRPAASWPRQMPRRRLSSPRCSPSSPCSWAVSE